MSYVLEYTERKGKESITCAMDAGDNASAALALFVVLCDMDTTVDARVVVRGHLGKPVAEYKRAWRAQPELAHAHAKRHGYAVCEGVVI
jgi:hypothetical protein